MKFSDFLPEQTKSKSLDEYQERLIKATIELSVVSSHAADRNTQIAAIRGYNAIMQYMRSDKGFQKAVVG